MPATQNQLVDSFSHSNNKCWCVQSDNSEGGISSCRSSDNSPENEMQWTPRASYPTVKGRLLRLPVEIPVEAYLCL